MGFAFYATCILILLEFHRDCLIPHCLSNR